MDSRCLPVQIIGQTSQSWGTFAGTQHTTHTPRTRPDSLEQRSVDAENSVLFATLRLFYHRRYVFHLGLRVLYWAPRSWSSSHSSSMKIFDSTSSVHECAVFNGRFGQLQSLADSSVSHLQNTRSRPNPSKEFGLRCEFCCSSLDLSRSRRNREAGLASATYWCLHTPLPLPSVIS